ncbi:hypothetical protein MGSAQ_000371 [marine sediment metagenome]|uniref:Uncharacterized protein n=1 Tax=marine sediment metagenome TaxID=412755 RepID=A0A1B6NXI2_9ZZZZ
MGARHDLDDGAFAAAVLAQQVIGLSRLDRQIDPGKGAHAAEPLVDAAKLQEGGVGTGSVFHRRRLPWGRCRDVGPPGRIGPGGPCQGRTIRTGARRRCPCRRSPCRCRPPACRRRRPA